MKDYIVRFNKEAVIVENCTDAMALTTIMVVLRSERFHYSMVKNALRTFTELLSRAQKYSNADKLTNAKRGVDPDPQRTGEKRKRNNEQDKNRDKRNRPRDNRGPRVPQIRYFGYTPLSIPKEQMLMQIRDLDLL